MIPISNPSISHDKGIFIGRNIYTNAPVYIDTFIGPPKLPNPHVFICGTSGGGWAISLIWAMMILPLADALQNSLQNLTSRIAGVDNEQMAGKAIGMGAGIGAMVGYGIGTIKEQFKSPTSNTNNNINNGGNSNNGLRVFVNRVSSVINPNMNLSAEKDYDGNANPIQNVIQKDTTNPFSISGIINRENPFNTSSSSANTITNNRENSINNSSQNSLVSKIANTGYNATKEYLKMGAKLTEGDFGDESYKSNNRVVRLNNIINPENRFRNNNFYTDYTDKLIDEKKLGEVNEFKGKS